MQTLTTQLHKCSTKTKQGNLCTGVCCFFDRTPCTRIHFIHEYAMDLHCFDFHLSQSLAHDTEINICVS